MNKAFVLCVLLITETLFIGSCFSIAELFPRCWNKNSQQIFTRLARHHIQRLSESDAVATQSYFCTSWICIVLALVKQCIICIQIFGLVSTRANIKAESVDQGAASAVASVDTFNIKLKFSIVFVHNNDVHIQQFSIYSKLFKSRAFEKSVLSIVASGLYPTCITSIAFTINARHTRGLFAMKCITMCSDMNI